jgi:hypothetical protein
MVHNIYQYFKHDTWKADDMTRTVVDNVAKREEWMVEVCGIEL